MRIVIDSKQWMRECVYALLHLQKMTIQNCCVIVRVIKKMSVITFHLNMLNNADMNAF